MKERAHIRLSSFTAHLLFLCVALLFLACFIAFVINTTAKNRTTSFASKKQIVKLWNQEDYANVLTLSLAKLDQNKIDAHALFFAGAAQYQLLMLTVPAEDQKHYFDRAILNLRTYLGLKKHLAYKAEAHYLLGKAYYHWGKAYASFMIQHLKKALSLGYHNTDIVEYMGMAYILLEDYQTGLQYLNQISYKENNFDLEYNMAEAYFLTKDYEKALKIYSNIYTNCLDDHLRDQAYFKTANIYFFMGQYTNAKEIYVDYLTRHPHNVEAHIRIGDLYALEENRQAALREWNIALRLEPKNTKAFSRIYGD